MPQPQSQLPSPSITLSCLSPETPSQIFLSTIASVLTPWRSGLLSHTHPTETATLPQTFLNLLAALPEHPWHALDSHQISFLQYTLLTTLIESPQIHPASLPLAAPLLTLHKPTRAVLVSALFLILRFPNAAQLRHIILYDASEAHLLSVCLARLLPFVSKALTEDIETLAENITPAVNIVYTLLTMCTHASLTNHATTLRAMLYPLLEHPSVETRVPGLRLFKLLSERCGVVSASVPFLNTSLLWNDPDSALIAVPLLITHLVYLGIAERRVVEKRLLESVIALSTASKDRYPCIQSVQAAVKLLPCVDELVSCNGQRYLRAMGAFLGRVGEMVPGGNLEKPCVSCVCEALVKGVRRWWIFCDGFRADVFKGCLICFMEIDDIVVANGVRDVLLTLAKCHPGRMGRMLKDVRESVTGFAGMGRVVRFLEDVERDVVDVKEMRRVETGRLVKRFFPEVNEFNLTR